MRKYIPYRGQPEPKYPRIKRYRDPESEKPLIASNVAVLTVIFLFLVGAAILNYKPAGDNLVFGALLFVSLVVLTLAIGVASLGKKSANTPHTEMDDEDVDEKTREIYESRENR